MSFVILCSLPSEYYPACNLLWMFGRPSFESRPEHAGSGQILDKSRCFLCGHCVQQNVHKANARHVLIFVAHIAVCLAALQCKGELQDLESDRNRRTAPLRE